MSRKGKRKSKKRRKKGTSSRSYTPIQQHTSSGGILKTGMSKLISGKGKLTHWLDERLPELLWVLLVLARGPRDDALDTLRAVGERIRSLEEPEKLGSVFLSDLAAADKEVLQEAFQPVLMQTQYRLALRPMLLFEQLPGRAFWQEIIREAPVPDDWKAVALATGASLFHQSEMATDARWARLFCSVAGGKLKLPSKELVWLINYPRCGDLREVRPFVRSCEQIIGLMPPEQAEWPAHFWDQCLRDTSCCPLQEKAVDDSALTGPTLQQVRAVRAELARHFVSTRKTSSIDAKHETVFGIALYSTAMLEELYRIGIGSGILGRLGLRAIVEAHITLSYLIKKDQHDLWSSFRAYGSGQAKLAFLKLEDLESPPGFVSPELLEGLANEDLWAEFVDINIGHWDKTNLRAMSIAADQKATYDLHYSWSSTFAHSHWCAVRDSVFVTCGNPLHRAHRIPRPETRPLGDVIPDACRIVDMIIANVLHCYPGKLEASPLLQSEAS